MKSFLSEVIQDLISNYSNELGELLIVVPNKRASILIKSEITKQLKTVVFSPKIVSIEESTSSEKISIQSTSLSDWFLFKDLPVQFI